MLDRDLFCIGSAERFIFFVMLYTPETIDARAGRGPDGLIGSNTKFPNRDDNLRVYAGRAFGFIRSVKPAAQRTPPASESQIEPSGTCLRKANSPLAPSPVERCMRFWLNLPRSAAVDGL